MSLTHFATEHLEAALILTTLATNAISHFAARIVAEFTDHRTLRRTIREEIAPLRVRIEQIEEQLPRYLRRKLAHE